MGATFPFGPLDYFYETAAGLGWLCELPDHGFRPLVEGELDVCVECCLPAEDHPDWDEIVKRIGETLRRIIEETL